jgi:choline dehydrogenase
MGPASDPDSVVDAEGRVHGIEGLYVADASIMPSVTSGNTNMPTAVVGERIGRSLLGLTKPLADGGPHLGRGTLAIQGQPGPFGKKL